MTTVLAWMDNFLMHIKVSMNIIKIGVGVGFGSDLVS